MSDSSLNKIVQDALSQVSDSVDSTLLPKRTRLVDSNGNIARVKSKMSNTCSVRKSPLCEQIISKRLQGYSVHKISDWLNSIGEEFYISPATLYNNLSKGFSGLSSPLAIYDEIIESTGADEVKVDSSELLLGLAFIQSKRIDTLVRYEASVQDSKPGYSHKSLRQEFETCAFLLEKAAKLKMLLNGYQEPSPLVSATFNSTFNSSTNSSTSTNSLVLSESPPHNNPTPSPSPLPTSSYSEEISARVRDLLLGFNSPSLDELSHSTILGSHTTYSDTDSSLETGVDVDLSVSVNSVL